MEPACWLLHRHRAVPADFATQVAEQGIDVLFLTLPCSISCATVPEHSHSARLVVGGDS